MIKGLELTLENKPLIYGSLSIFIISVVSLSGVVSLPLLRKGGGQRWMHFFVAMAIGTLSGDAFLHLLPQILGQHSHMGLSGHGHAHDTVNATSAMVKHDKIQLNHSSFDHAPVEFKLRQARSLVALESSQISTHDETYVRQKMGTYVTYKPLKINPDVKIYNGSGLAELKKILAEEKHRAKHESESVTSNDGSNEFFVRQELGTYVTYGPLKARPDVKIYGKFTELKKILAEEKRQANYKAESVTDSNGGKTKDSNFEAKHSLNEQVEANRSGTSDPFIEDIEENQNLRQKMEQHENKEDGHGHSHENGHGHSHENGHGHSHEDGHGHSHEDGHGHSHKDGHDHSHENGHGYSHGNGHSHQEDGHGHSHENGHGHSHEDGHGHSHEDGHGHSHEDGHGHSHKDGHDHSHENGHGHSHENGHSHQEDGHGHSHGNGHSHQEDGHGHKHENGHGHSHEEGHGHSHEGGHGHSHEDGHGHSHKDGHGHSHENGHGHSHGNGHSHLEDGHGHSHENGHEHSHEDGHGHSHEDGHGHSHEDGHGHSHEDGHGHSHENGHGHSHGDGHGHSHEDGHGHSHEDGHGHSHENGHGHSHENGHGHSHGHSHGDDGHGHSHGNGHGHSHSAGNGQESGQKQIIDDRRSKDELTHPDPYANDYESDGTEESSNCDHEQDKHSHSHNNGHGHSHNNGHGHTHNDGHGHSHADGHGHSHSAEELEKSHNNLIYLTIILVTIGVLYLMEFTGNNAFRSNANKIEDVVATDKAISSGWITCDEVTVITFKEEGKVASPFAQDPVIFWGLKSVALTILLGDALHNFMDGVAVGATFVISPTMGITTSIAVVLHEIPHEIGDFVVLLETGLSVKKAVLLNFLSALTAFLGLFFGLSAVQLSSSLPILLAVTSGMFLYVAWMDLLVQMKQVIHDDSWPKVLICQTLGLIIGYAVMFMIGWYEHLAH